MANKSDLKPWVIDALQSLGGSGRCAQIAQHIWNAHETELRSSGDLFYTWRYDMRWSGQKLQHEGKLSKSGKNYTWFLTP